MDALFNDKEIDCVCGDTGGQFGRCMFVGMCSTFYFPVNLALKLSTISQWNIIYKSQHESHLISNRYKTVPVKDKKVPPKPNKCLKLTLYCREARE